jgi:hypothetical protein
MARLPVAGPVVIPNCIEVLLSWTSSNRTFHNALHGNLTAVGPINPGMAETLFSAIKANAATTTWLGHLGTGVRFAGCAVKDLRAPNNPMYFSTGTVVPGTAVGVELPLSSSLVVTLRTAQSGQGFRGRVYLAGMTDAALASPLAFLDTVGTDAVAFIEGVDSAMGTQNIPMVVAQRALQAGTHHDGSPWAARDAGVLDVIAKDIANPRIDSQRKRLGR